MFKKMIRNREGLLTTLIGLLFLLSFSFCFISGSANGNVKVEEAAEYIGDVIENHTKKSMYAALIVEPNDKTEKKMIDPGLEFYDLYGVFKQTIASYVGTVNADHSNDVYFRDIESNCLTFLYSGTSSGLCNSIEYHGHYKHADLPLELMFRSVKDPEEWGKKGFDSLIFISKSQANKLLDLYGLDHSENNYKSLIKSRIFLNINGKEKEWQIENIYLEQNYYYEAIMECAGEFVFAWSSNAFTEGLKKQSIYFLSPYTFRNLFYFDYATSLYPQSDFNYKISNYNFIDDYKIDESKLVYSVASHDSIISTMVLVLGIVLAIINLIIIYFVLPEIKWWHHLLFGVIAITPYLLFKCIYLITGNVVVFTNFATTANMIMLLSVILLYSIIVLLKKRKAYAAD